MKPKQCVGFECVDLQLLWHQVKYMYMQLCKGKNPVEVFYKFYGNKQMHS
jgi:hypothetical protein